MWKLVIEDDEGKRTVVSLNREAYTIGREEGNTIRLTERNVSRKHARLRRMNGPQSACVVEDLSSYNGVFVNGQRVVRERPLAHGDLVQIGDYRIVLEDERAAGQESERQFDSATTLPNATALGQRPSLLLDKQKPNRLVMLVGPTPGAEYPLDREIISLGRAEDASISVNHNSVSRLHCEIHAFGDGRFEIVDKGSSNGVRVNAADLRRGIIEAGDVIELGDVRFKFVGAGQIFIPGPNESQMLAAIADRPAKGTTKSSSSGMYIFFGAIIALAAAGVLFYVARLPPKTPPITNNAQVDPLAAERPVLEEAKQLCTAGRCLEAHQKVNRDIREGSPLRDTADFHLVENRWAEQALAAADAEVDVNKKKSLLAEVVRSTAVDPSLRRTASEKLQALEVNTITAVEPVPTHEPETTALSVAPPTKPRESTATPPSTSVRERHRISPVTETVTPATSTATTTKPVAKTDADRARDELLKQPPNYAMAKSILEPKVMGNRGSSDEVRLLKEVCKALSDRPCVEFCKQKLAQ